MAEVTLRPLAVDDAEAMVHVLGDASLYEQTGGEPPTLEALRLRYGVQVRGHSADVSEVWRNEIVLLDGRPIGFVQATIDAEATAEIAWVIGRSWQGSGFASRAAQLLVARLAADGVREIIAHIRPGHAASEAIARRLSMAPTDTIVDGEVRWRAPLEAS